MRACVGKAGSLCGPLGRVAAGPGGMTIELSRFRTDVVRRIYGYWRAKCVDGRLPRRADVRPEELAGLLPWVFLVDVAEAPLGFRFRLVGTEIGLLAGAEYTGVRINAAEYGPHWQRIFNDYAAVVQTRMPSYVDARAPWGAREFLHYERIIMPLSTDGLRVDVLFGALHPTEPAEPLV